MRALLSLIYLMEKRLPFVKTTALGPFDISSVELEHLWYFHEISVEVLN